MSNAILKTEISNLEQIFSQNDWTKFLFIKKKNERIDLNNIF